MTPLGWAVLPLKKYADFNGRAPRAEYWWYILASTVVGFAVGRLDNLIPTGPIIGIYGPLSLACTLGLVVPGIAVAIRRLHDINRSAWWILLDAPSYFFVVVAFFGKPSDNLFKNMNAAALVPILGIAVIAVLVMMIVMLVFMVTQGTEGPNDYGPDPYGRDHLEEVFA